MGIRVWYSNAHLAKLKPLSNQITRLRRHPMLVLSFPFSHCSQSDWSGVSFANIVHRATKPWQKIIVSTQWRSSLILLAFISMHEYITCKTILTGHWTCDVVNNRYHQGEPEHYQQYLPVLGNRLWNGSRSDFRQWCCTEHLIQVQS